MTGTLILLCGLAGAGKTTMAKQLEADGAVRMCPDEWLVALGFDVYDRDARIAVEGLQWELSQALVLSGLTVVDECGVWQREERDLRRAWARAHGVAVELRFLDATVEVLTARVAERNRTLSDGEPRIDPALVAFWDERIDRPGAEELALFDPPAGHISRMTTSPRLVLLCGLPASGKTTLARELADTIPAVRLDKDHWTTQLGRDVWDDEFRVLLEARLWVLTQELLARGQSVILEWGHWARVERDEKRLGARALGVGVELHHLHAPLDELIERARRRTESGEWTAAPMTRAHFEQWATAFQPPDDEELLLFDEPAG